MVFSSNIFLFIFLPAFFGCYYAVKFSYKSYVIVIGSYLFYAWWRPDFLLLFVAVSAWNYVFGIYIYKHITNNKKLAYKILTLGVIGDLAALGYFKYANFGADIIASALTQFGWDTFTLEHIILPLGISFYIFQAISYIVDIYRGDAKPTNRFVDFAAYIALFPQLIAGPIVRYNTLSEQLRERSHSWDLFSLGVSRFMLGFIKKVFIADSIAPFNAYLLTSPNLSMMDSWLVVTGSFIQLYFDFSAYSDMAIGLGLMMGFKFPQNFNHPFASMSFTEFWKRWHLTLSEFLRDYVFKPLMKLNIFGFTGTMLITMIISGIWHGADVTFILFGLFFGIGITLEKTFNIATKIHSPYNIFRNLFTLILIFLIMPCFTSGDITKAMEIYKAMLGLSGLGNLNYLTTQVGYMIYLFYGIAVGWIILSAVINRRNIKYPDKRYYMDHVSGWNAFALWILFFVSVTRLESNSFSPFLYFQF